MGLKISFSFNSIIIKYNHQLILYYKYQQGHLHAPTFSSDSGLFSLIELLFESETSRESRLSSIISNKLSNNFSTVSCLWLLTSTYCIPRFLAANSQSDRDLTLCEYRSDCLLSALRPTNIITGTGSPLAFTFSYLGETTLNVIIGNWANFIKI